MPLTNQSLYENLRAVGIERVPEVFEETRARARAVALVDRIEVRAIDARDPVEESEFALAF